MVERRQSPLQCLGGRGVAVKESRATAPESPWSFFALQCVLDRKSAAQRQSCLYACFVTCFSPDSFDGDPGSMPETGSRWMRSRRSAVVLLTAAGLCAAPGGD